MYQAGLVSGIFLFWVLFLNNFDVKNYQI